MSAPVVVILAGGSGTRFWPLSTPSRPKQFLTLLGDRTLLQSTVDRVGVPHDRILVITSEDGVDTVRAQLPDLPPDHVVGEPLQRDTAAAIALATLLVASRFGDVVTVVLPADHHIAGVDRFRRQLAEVVADAHHGGILTFGVPPSGPSAAYGYLAPDSLTEGAFVVRRFHEKPDRDTAAAYVAAGHLWNSGIFVFRPSVMRAELARQLPEHLRLLGAAVIDGDLARAYALLPKRSIDHGVMEGAAEVRGHVAQFDWSDVGGWEALGAFLPTDGHGNRHRGEVRALDAADNVVFCEDPTETVALIGVTGLVVVRVGGRTLVAPRDRVDELKLLLG